MRDVAVLGAGMAGSSVAKALADKGWDTLLIDRRPFPRHKVCGEFLSPESRTALQALGLWETVESLGPSPIERVRLVFESGPPLEIPLPGTAGRQPLCAGCGASPRGAKVGRGSADPGDGHVRPGGRPRVCRRDEAGAGDPNLSCARRHCRVGGQPPRRPSGRPASGRRKKPACRRQIPF
jgi:choline dehydrogenase-like flavoprotein